MILKVNYALKLSNHTLWKSLSVSKNPYKECVHNTAYSVQLPYMAGLSLLMILYTIGPRKKKVCIFIETINVNKKNEKIYFILKSTKLGIFLD